MPRKATKEKKPKPPKFGERESYQVGEWVEIAGGNRYGPGKIGRVDRVNDEVLYVLQTIDGTVHDGIRAERLRPWQRRKN